MLKQRRAYADQVAASLFEAEAAMDAALAKAAALAGVMPALRAQAGLSALIGQDAVEWTSRSISALAEARRALVEAHMALSAAQKQIGLGAVAYGDGAPKPQDAVRGPALRSIDGAAA